MENTTAVRRSSIRGEGGHHSYVSLAIPLLADAIFVALAGPSGGGVERLTLYLVPPALALMAGAAAVNWKRVLIWLPVAVIAIMGAAVALLFTNRAGRITEAADIRVIAAALLLASTVVALHCWHRRGKLRAIPVLACLLPSLAAYGAACTGWNPERDMSPPHGVDATNLNVQWHPSVKPRLTGGVGHGGQCTLVLPLKLGGLRSGVTAHSSLRRVQITPEGRSPFSATGGRVLQASYKGQRIFDESDPGFIVELSGDQAEVLRDRSCEVSGTVRLFFYERKPKAIPLNGTHTVRENGCQWRITPFIEYRIYGHGTGDWRGPRWWRRTEFISTRPVMNARREAYLDPESGFFYAPGGRQSIQVDTFSHDHSLNVWEGAGLHEEAVDFRTGGAEEAETIRHLTAADPAVREGWELHFDVMVYAGTLDVPFTLHMPQPEADLLPR